MSAMVVGVGISVVVLLALKKRARMNRPKTGPLTTAPLGRSGMDRFGRVELRGGSANLCE